MSRQSRDPEAVSLTGEWRAHDHEPDLARTFAEPDLDDTTWTRVTVPHHWRDEPEFETGDGPLLYRRRFTTPRRGSGDRPRWFVELDGIFYYGDVWLDGEYLGTTEGYFVPHAFEVTDALRARDDHVLAVEVACPPQHDRGAKRTITGGYWQSPVFDRALNPGGIWRAVRLASCGAVRIEQARVSCVEASIERGRLALHVRLDAADEVHGAALHAVVRGPDDTVLLDAHRATTLATGRNELEWTLTVEEPPRWWPRGLGPQAMCTLDVDVEIDGRSSDGFTRRVAFRDVRRRGARFHVNGEALFLKGACYTPARALLGHADAELVRADVASAVTIARAWRAA